LTTPIGGLQSLAAVGERTLSNRLPGAEGPGALQASV
jgi:hypothetical protein